MALERRIYRASLGAWLWALIIVAVCMTVLLGRLYSRTDLVGAGLVWTGVCAGMVFALLLTWIARTGTVITEAGVTVRELRSRLHSWTEIADIREDEFGQAVIWDRDLWQVPLPHLNRKRLGATFISELNALIAEWEARRGAAWRSRADEIAQKNASIADEAQASQKRANLFVWAFLAAMASLAAILAVMVVTADIGPRVNPAVELLLWPGMLLVPVAVFMIIYMIGSARIRARKRR